MDLLSIILQNRKDIQKLKKQLCCIQNFSSVIPVTSNDFNIDGVTYSNSLLNGKHFEIFSNDLNRFLYNEVGNQEWNYISGGGFEILLPGFDASSTDYHLYIIPKV